MTTLSPTLRRIAPDAVPTGAADAVPPEAAAVAAEILADVRSRGWPAVRERAERYGDLQPGAPAVLGPDAMEAALESLDPTTRGALERAADRIRSFAVAQRAAILDVRHPIPGGTAGLRYAAVERAGCYAPGGRYPLPSSVLMTAITARAAGVREVWVASPRPAPATLAAAALAGADFLLAVGGAQAIAALAVGAGEVPAVDAIVGPGNQYVVAAKQQVSGRVAIDMLAGPSELLVLADGSADPERIAADLLAQAEHDPQAVPALVSLDPHLPDRVDAALARQLATLPTADIAAAALGNGWATVARSLDEAIALCDRLAPEHLALHLAETEEPAARLAHYGALFVGEQAAEVLGDYGAGPNHTLPTGGTARSFGALSVMSFLRAQTWLRLDDPAAARGLVQDSITLARVEGLEAHARAAEAR